MGQLKETYRGVVYPFQCDHQGHLTTYFDLEMRQADSLPDDMREAMTAFLIGE